MAEETGFDLRTAFVEYGQRVERFLVRLGVSRADAQDLTTETFMCAQDQRQNYDATRPLRPWLFGIAANLARRHHRRGWLWSTIRGVLERDQAGREGSATPDGEVIRLEQSAFVREVLAQLPHRRRELIVLRDLEGLSTAEVARVLDMREGTVHSALHHARRHFARLYRARTREET